MSLVTEKNPCGLNGVDFIEYSGPQAAFFETLFKNLSFKEVGQMHGRNIKLFRQGNINFILNCEPQTFATEFAQVHGPSITSTGFIVENAKQAYQTAVSRGARPYEGDDHHRAATPFPAVYGIGDSLIYFMDEANLNKLYTEIFQVSKEDLTPKGVGLYQIDHFTNNVPAGEMQKWCDFYQNVFNFHEARYFNIKGAQTGLFSKVMRSPCMKFSVPINEPTGEKSQIQEYLEEYKGSGIQHLALITDNILDTLEAMKKMDIHFLTPPPKTYYAMLKDRLPQVSEDIVRLEENAILVDGDHDGYLLQIFTKNIIGPIFFEVIQRKNHFGFGEGNFQALFDSIERDQKERGYL